MARIAVVAVLAALQLAAPWLCCCTAARFAAPAQGPDPTQVEPTLPEPTSPPPCCCHPEPVPCEAPPQAQPGNSDAPRPPAHPGCPCRQHSDRNAALAPGRESAKQSLLQYPSQELVCLLSFAPVDRWQAPAGACSAADGACSLPFLSADDILRAFHFLRC
jgi:hypothetical protein